MNPRRLSDRILDALPWLGLVALALSVSLQKIRTFDYWWQLRTGQLIAETGAVPKVDVYTYTVEGSRWIDIHWLFQLGLHAVHRLGGHEGVVVAKAVLVLALVALLARIGWRRERSWVTVLGLGLMLLIACDRFMPRPELPSFVLLAGILVLLDRDGRRADRGLWGVVPLQLLWVNLHGLFALGVAVCGIYAVAEWLRPWLVPGTQRDARRVRRLAALTLAVTGISVVNPNGIDGALYPITQLGMIGPPEDRGLFGSLIAELIPPLSGRQEQSGLVLAFSGSLALLSALAMGLNWRRVHAADPLLWVAFAYLALGASRNLALFAIVAAPIFARNLNEVLDRRPLPGWSRLASLPLAAALLWVTSDVVRDRFFPRVGSMREFGLGVFEPLYPSGAMDWIERARPDGPVAHHMADGGYLLWRLYPDYRSMVDGRLEVFGAERFLDLHLLDPKHFKTLEERYGFGSVLVHYGLVASGPLLQRLHRNPNWQLVHLDDGSALFVHRERAGLPWARDLDVDAPDLFPPLSAASRRPSDLVRRMGRTHFYMMMKRNAQALELWEETLERYPDLPQGPIVHAGLLHRNGLSAAAEAILRRLLGERPDDPKLLSQVGDLRTEAGDLEAARSLYQRAQAADEDFTYATYRLGLLAEEAGNLDEALRLYGRVLSGSPPQSTVAVLAKLRLIALGATP